MEHWEKNIIRNSILMSLSPMKRDDCHIIWPFPFKTTMSEPKTNESFIINRISLHFRSIIDLMFASVDNALTHSSVSVLFDCHLNCKQNCFDSKFQLTRRKLSNNRKQTHTMLFCYLVLLSQNCQTVLCPNVTRNVYHSFIRIHIHFLLHCLQK